MSNVIRPFLGVAYYPEDWPETEMIPDMKRMKEIGIQTIRIAEFAWHKMEPECGKFDFSFFRRVVDTAKEMGLSVIMGTPTATPPRWLSKMHPDVFKEGENGRKQIHGGRRHCCSNNARYNEYSMRIVEKMAQEFCADENIIGWQIDNEIYEWTPAGGCYCENCVKGFQKYLEGKYKTIDNLNEKWNLNLFSQWYDDFADIPAPRDTWHNPHIRQEWITFQNESHIAFVHRQADILHAYVSVPVGTDTMPFGAMDYRHMTSKLDIVQFNHYNTPENLHACAFWFDHLRTLKDAPFWNTETATNWNGSTTITQSVKPEGFCRVNSWLPVALGGEANLYWLWRTHWAGHELMHGAVIDTSGRDMHTVGEVKKTAQDFKKCAEFIQKTRVHTEAAIHYASENLIMNAYQPVVQGLDYLTVLQEKFYAPLTEKGVRPDVIDSLETLDKYRLIFSPMMMTLENEDLAERMAEWVKNGGTWVVGPLTDVRDRIGARYKDRFYGTLETLTGITWRYAAPDCEGHIKAVWQDGTPFEGETWFEMCDADDAEALVTVTEGHSAFVHKALVVKKKVGRGTVILLGSIPSDDDARRIQALALRESGIRPMSAEGRIMVCPRRGEDTEGFILVEYANAYGCVHLNAPMKELISGKTLEGYVDISPYDVLVLEKI